MQFIVGVGLANEHANDIGYQAISIVDLIKDVLSPVSKYDSKRILEGTIPTLGKGATFIPVFRYLKDCGIDSAETYEASGFNVSKHMLSSRASYRGGDGYAKAFLRSEKNKDAAQIMSTNPPEKAALFLAFLPPEQFDAELIRAFLVEHADRLDSTSSYSTFFRKLACLYDRHVYGGDDAAPRKRIKRTRPMAPLE